MITNFLNIIERKQGWRWALALVVVLVLSPALWAVQMQDLVRVKGAESSKIVGMGLVIGLNGTGDGVQSATTIRRLAAMMNRMGDEVVSASELKNAENVAVVYLSAKVPSGGMREGDALDVQIAAPIASSLRGGRLALSPILGPIPGAGVFAMAEGAIVLEDKTMMASGIVYGGATAIRDVRANYLDTQGRLTFVIDQPSATWPIANMMTMRINDLMAPDSPPIAFADDQKNIVIQVPRSERQHPGSFISQLLEIQIDQSLVQTEARVLINTRSGSIVMTGRVEISPVMISHRGMTITTITPEPQPTEVRPRVKQHQVVSIDPAKRGGARLSDLLAAFDQMNVAIDDRIAIIKEIHRSGKLHAQLIVKD